jgi:PAS domain S-box-containing protein
MGIVALDPLDPSALTRRAIRASVIITDADLRVLHLEGPAFDRHGYRPEEWPGRLLSEVLPAALMTELEPRYRAALAGHQQSFDYWSHDRRSAYWAQITPVRDGDGAATSVVAVMQDVTDRLGTIDDLSRSEARLRESERMVGVGSWEMTPETGLISYSQGYAHLLGLAPGERLDVAGLMKMVHPEDHLLLVEAAATCVATGSAQCEHHVVSRDGTVRTLEAHGEIVRAQHGRPEYLRGAILDVTEQRQAEVERLEAVSMFRQGFDTAPIGMVLTDPGSGVYTRINDTMCALLDRPREQLIGASSEAVTHPDDQAAMDDARRANLDNSSHPGVEREIRFLRPDGTTVWAAVNAAPVFSAAGTLQAVFSQVIDITARKAQEARFEEDVNDALWLGRIRDAIDDDRLVLYSQPIVDLLTGATVQQELLLRIRGEDGVVTGPGEFLPIAERYGLISEIDRWVIRQAVDLAAQGEATEFNLSGASIGDPDVVRELASALDQTGADPSLLVIEVTETAMMTQPDVGRLFAEQLIALGCGLALDDFGTGYASLSYLKQIPAQHLKIDIEFVRDLVDSETDERLLRGIVGIAREFDQTTIAEGIENHPTLVRLRELGVHRGQGYLFGHPRPLAGPVHAPPVTVGPDRQAPGADPVSVVRRAFTAFAGRDLDTMIELCRPDIVVRPHQSTSELTGRLAPYRGHEGLRAYFRDLTQVWKTLKLTPTGFRAANQSVIVFGRADARSGTETKTVSVLWVWQLRDGLIASIEVFQTPHQAAASGSTRPTPARASQRPPVAFAARNPAARIP